MSDAALPPLQISEVQRSVTAELDRIAPVIDELGRRFRDAGHELALVGGPVRDAMLGRHHNDLDFTTSARPEQTEDLLRGWADAIWDMGRAFGTIGCRKGDWQVEITTYRSETYDPSSRKPDVDFGDTLAGDLGRRDFTVNAMAVLVPDRAFEDPYGGVVDLAHRVLRTPGRPEDSFSDDPLRMMRAARFASQLGFTVAPEVVAAMTAMADRIEIISAERVRDELVKLVCGRYPRLGLTLLVETGLAAHVLPELPGARARARRAPPAQGRLRAHAHRAGAVDRPRAPAGRWRAPTSSPASRRSCTTSASRGPAASSTTARSPSTTTTSSAPRSPASG